MLMILTNVNTFNDVKNNKVGFKKFKKMVFEDWDRIKSRIDFENCKSNPVEKICFSSRVGSWNFQVVPSLQGIINSQLYT